VLDTGGGSKTDTDDARSVALTALHHKGLHEVRYEDQSTILRLLSERRDDLVRERTRVLNRLHQLLRELIAGGVPTGLNAAQAAAALRRVRPLTATDTCRRGPGERASSRSAPDGFQHQGQRSADA
jgi:transposase